jgi:hypothetical protein
LGWIVGRNVHIDYRWGAGDVERYRAIATDLVSLAPDAVLAEGYATVSALQKMTRSAPIVAARGAEEREGDPRIGCDAALVPQRPFRHRLRSGGFVGAGCLAQSRMPQTKLEKLPRMADFALWASACETALWRAGTFWSAYCGNRDEAVEGVIDADPIAGAVRALVAARAVWTGTASELLGALAEISGDRVAKSKTWPDSRRALAGRLRRAAISRRPIPATASHCRVCVFLYFDLVEVDPSKK